MKTDLRKSWAAFILFYLVLIAIVSILDWFNQVLAWSYWGAQVGLITLGVGIFAAVGIWTPDLSAARGIFLAFTVGILTIIPAVLMGLGRIPGFWPQYFYVALGMASGSLLTFLSMKFARRIQRKDQSGEE
jgi:hypothetical protein